MYNLPSAHSSQGNKYMTGLNILKGEHQNRYKILFEAEFIWVNQSRAQGRIRRLQNIRIIKVAVNNKNLNRSIYLIYMK